LLPPLPLLPPLADEPPLPSIPLPLPPLPPPDDEPPLPLAEPADGLHAGSAKPTPATPNNDSANEHDRRKPRGRSIETSVRLLRILVSPAAASPFSRY
jgi:hypothetical protein